MCLEIDDIFGNMKKVVVLTFSFIMLLPLIEIIVANKKSRFNVSPAFSHNNIQS